MFISLIVPIYNIAPNLLGACLASASMQTLRKHEYEVILVDDASTATDTLELMADQTSHNQNVVLVKHATNLGLNAARQSGVNACRGDYVVFLDGDDILTCDALELLRRYAYVFDADVVTASLSKWFPLTKSYTGIQITQKAFPNDYMDRLSQVISGKFSYTMCGRLFRRDVLLNEIFSMPNLYHEDLTTFMRILFKTSVTSHVPETLYYYSDNDLSITKRTSEEHADGIFFALEDWIDEADRHDLLGELITSISDGAARLLDDCVLKRCISNPQIGVESKLEILESVARRFAELALPPSPRALQLSLIHI